MAGVRRRFAPHQLRHAHAVEMSREGISLIVIQRQLGHADLAVTSRYLRGIDSTEIPEVSAAGDDKSLSMLVAYTQLTAADLLRALGTERDPADERVVQTAQ